MRNLISLTARDFAAIAILATTLVIGLVLVTLPEQPYVQIVDVERTTYTVQAIHLNSAGVKELALLPGIGPHRAKMIVADRARRGPFVSVDSLQRVHGIGPGIVNAIRAHVTIK